MRRFRRVALAAALAAGAIAAIVVPGSAAQAATPVCNSYGVRYHSVLPMTSSGSLSCHLQQGNTGIGVAYLQATINICYEWLLDEYDIPELAQDGQFGPKTKFALQNVQAIEEIPHDGIYGPQTLQAMLHLDESLDGSCHYLY